MAEHIFHLASRSDWVARTDVYQAPSIEDEGFIHCSTWEQIPEVARRHFRGHTDLMLLHIDPDLMGVDVVYEDLYDTGEDYPHIYGPIPTSAIVSATPYLTHLEEGMWGETRADPEWMDHVLHAEFTEVGRSGRLYDRAEAIEATDYPYEYELPHADLEVDFVGDDIALVTYVSRESLHGEELPAHRTSLWVHTDTGWRLRFHQGTPLPPGPGESA
jgi:uncharacterized protein (DUF952 family)